MASKVTCTCGWSWNKSDSSKKDMYVCHQCGKDNTMKNGGWLSKFDVPEAENGIEGTMGGLTDKGFNYNGAWGGTMQMGGDLLKSWNPKLAKNDKEFIKWYTTKTLEGKAGTSYDSPNSVYDFYSYFKNTPKKELSNPEQHFPDTYKLPNHPTFSNESIYSTPENPGGFWVGENYLPNGKFGKFQMGGSLPGSVGFTYARTQDPAPSKGKYAKKTMASAQNGQEMKFYQEGLDWKPKTISRDGGWLGKYEEGGIIEDDRGQWEYPGEITKINSNQITMQGVDYPVLGISDTGDTQMMQPGQDYTYEGESVTEIPMMQGGGKASLRSLMNNDDLKSKSDATKVIPQKTMTKEQAAKLKARKDAEELQRRKQAIETSNVARAKPLSELTYWNPTKTLADISGAVGDKLRIFPNDPDSFIDEYINPGVMVGNMASGLGRVPLNIQEGNYGQAAMSVATPLAVGALESLSAPYINNVMKSVRQYLPEKGQFINEIKDLKRAIAPAQPTFINPTEQELLSTVRNVGIMSKTGANDAAVLEKILNKSAQLGEKEFESLVGSTKSQIQERIQAIKASGSTKKPDVNNGVIDLRRSPSSQTTIASELGIDQDPSWLSLQARLRERGHSVSTPAYDVDGNIVSEPSTADIARAIQASGEIDLSTINSSQAQRARRVQELMANSFNVSSTTPPSYFSLENTGLFDFSGPTNKSLIRGLTERVNKNKYLPLVADDSDSLLPSLYRDQSNNPTADILKAYRTLESAPKGSTFKGASSLSTDSYPATLRMTQKALKSDIADVNYIGMKDLNFSGFSQAANVSKDINIKEINTMIDQLNKKLPKPIPYAYEKADRIVAPQITVTRKKNGGWLSKYN